MWVNAVLFQIGWFTCVLERSWIAVGVTALILLVHGLYVRAPRWEWLAVGLITCAGITQDVVLIQLDVLRFDTHPWPPLWMLCMWLLFATTLNHSMRWLADRWWLASLLGAIAGPLSYLAGERLGAVSVNHDRLPILALAWAIALPLYYVLLNLLKEPLPSCRAPSE